MNNIIFIYGLNLGARFSVYNMPVYGDVFNDIFIAFQEHHLQRAIIAGLIIPTPEVSDVKDDIFFDKNYPPDFRQPRQMIHVQRKNRNLLKQSMHCLNF